MGDTVMDKQWLREWSADECNNPPKTLREDVGALLAEDAAHEADLLAIENQRADLAGRLFAQEAELEALRAVADAAREVRFVGGQDLLNIAPRSTGALYAALDALPAPCPVNARQSPNGTAD